MDNEYKEAFTETLEILKRVEKDIINKIPKQFITFLESNKNVDYNPNIDFSDEKWEDTIKPETQAIIALIYRDYIVSKEERKKLIEEEEQEEIKIENERREKYNPDNVFKNRQKNIQDNLENNMQLIELKEYPWYKKVFNKILKVLGLKE